MCIFSSNNEVICNKCGKEEYGGYCYKHKREHLIGGEKNIIIYDYFTKKQSDYLRFDIVRTLSILFEKRVNTKLSKKELFQQLCNFFEMFDTYNTSNNLQKIIHIQRVFKNYRQTYITKLRGVGFTDPSICKNDTDFFTYDTYQEMDPKYFFSYKDQNNSVWFFDIRSFIKLIELRQTNPYTRDVIPNESIYRANKLSQILQLHLEKPSEEIIFISRKQRIKQKTIDIFSKIEQFGYECDFEWFLSLQRRELKNLYKNLEDIWNYRLQLTYEMKSRISPPNGLVFTTSIPEIITMSKEDLQELILQEVLKFDGAVLDSDKKLGFMYFIIGLGSVSLSCHNAHPWLLYV